MTTKTDAARALGIAEDEVLDIADSPAGLLVHTHDDNTYIIVPRDAPDAAGRTGVMYAVPPSVPYHGAFPVYTNLQAALDDDFLEPDRIGEDGEDDNPLGDDGGAPGTPGADPASAHGSDPADRTDDDGPDSEPVPEGSAAEILAWVGDDEDRAQRARAAEETKPSPRSGLLSSLERIGRA